METSELLKNSFLLIGTLVLITSFFGFLIAIVAKKYSIKVNPLVDEVDEELPKGQCGACGFAGCRQYAEKVVTDPNVAANLCIPGGEHVAKIVAQLTCKEAKAIVKQKIYLKCAGCPGIKNFALKHKYDGVKDCIAASIVAGGDKACEYGCLGYGTCEKVCPYGAITMGTNGLPEFDQAKCVSCGICVSTCPRKVIAFLPEYAKAHIKCNSNDKGAQTVKNCSVGCIACKMCVRLCPYNAITIVDNLAVIDQEICKTCPDAPCLKVVCKPDCYKDASLIKKKT